MTVMSDINVECVTVECTVYNAVNECDLESVSLYRPSFLSPTLILSFQSYFFCFSFLFSCLILFLFIFRFKQGYCENCIKNYYP